MGNIYTISELERKLSVTRPTVEKRLTNLWGSKPVPYTSKTVNNRDIMAIELSESQEIELGIKNEYEAGNETPSKPIEDRVKVNHTNDDITLKVLEYSERYATRLESYIERIVNAESSLKQIEDKRKVALDDLEYYKGEISRLTQELNAFKTKQEELKAENARLKEELEAERKKPFWKRSVI